MRAVIGLICCCILIFLWNPVPLLVALLVLIVMNQKDK
jgi:hypothetical protein